MLNEHSKLLLQKKLTAFSSQFLLLNYRENQIPTSLVLLAKDIDYTLNGKNGTAISHCSTTGHFLPQKQVTLCDRSHLVAQIVAILLTSLESLLHQPKIWTTTRHVYDCDPPGVDSQGVAASSDGFRVPFSILR